MRQLLTIISVCVSFMVKAQVDSSQNARLGFKVTPTQFLVGEKALITEIQFFPKYSAELKLGWFKGPRAGYSWWDTRNTFASGFVSQLGIKRYYNKSAFNLEEPYSLPYVQLLGLYKKSSYEKLYYEESSLSSTYNSLESQNVNTYGVKALLGVEKQFLKIMYYDAYAGVGYRVRSIDRLIYKEGYGSTAFTNNTYPLKKHENKAYFSPHVGINIGILLPRKPIIRK